MKCFFNAVKGPIFMFFFALLGVTTSLGYQIKHPIIVNEFEKEHILKMQMKKQNFPSQEVQLFYEMENCIDQLGTEY